MLNRPWNTSKQGKEIIGDKQVIICESLNEIIDTIEKLLKEDINMTLEYILNNVMYDLTFENGTILHGNLDYVSQHFGDDIIQSNIISQNQPTELQSFIQDLFNYNKLNNTNISITDFYNNVYNV